ncbi:hypothetical protein Tco_0027690 [Tanacetum coccineum]
MLVNALRRFRESLRRVTDGAEAFWTKLVPTMQTLISLTDDLSLLSNMAALESCPKHNMIAYLEKTEGNVEHITAKVAGKFVSISEASIRTDLIFDDADGIDSLPNQAIFDAIQLMGYEGDLTVLTFNKALFSPQWRFLFHTINHCLSSKSTSWDQIPTNITTAVRMRVLPQKDYLMNNHHPPLLPLVKFLMSTN